MGMVVDFGFNRANTFATDVFPFRVPYDPEVSDPFDKFPEFERVFLKRRLPEILKGDGVVLLVFGTVAFGKVQSLVSSTTGSSSSSYSQFKSHACREESSLDPQYAFKDLNVYLETSMVTKIIL